MRGKKVTTWSRRLLLTAILMLFVIPVSVLNAQGTLNDQKFFYTPQKDGWSGQTSLALALVKGQSDQESVSITGELGYIKGKSRTKLALNYAYGEAFKVSNTDNWKINLTTSYQLSNVLSLQVMGSRMHDQIQLLYARYWFGSALVYHAIKQSEENKFSVTTGAGIFYEHEQNYLDVTLDTKQDAETLWKAAAVLYFTWNLKKDVSLVSSTFFLVAFDDTDQHNVQSSTSLNTQLSKNISFNTIFKYSYNNIVPPGVPKYLLSLNTGLTLKL